MSNSLQPYGRQPNRFLCPWDSPDKNTGEGCYALLQGIFPTQGLNPGLLHYRQILYQLSHQGSPFFMVVLGNVRYIYYFLIIRYMLLLLLSRFSHVRLIDGSPLGSSVPGVLQARLLEWVAISFSTA